MPRAFAAAFVLLLLTGARLEAQEADPADLAFWQAIQNSTDPAEYKAYLEAFPLGRFAGLARIRASRTAAIPGPTPAAIEPPANSSAAGVGAAPASVPQPPSPPIEASAPTIRLLPGTTIVTAIADQRGGLGVHQADHQCLARGY